jgi:hypothetical protein
MKRWMLALCIGAALVPAATSSTAWAKKKAPKSQAEAKRGSDHGVRPPNDKRTNEGAQGRMNATEDASKEADSPQFGHRP